ncbi:CHAP domain-containing protein [Arthrobacter sp. EpRS71]|uniref:CHAP domain-containing protein n=1 Tax=Arthrobacter sp. EpRS71 TaxID=1743141 RepID=UPI00074781FB|nr:CHAP domain-containing protein [Arthrobacter sp. EpRS71]KUM39027.1 hypothetical protein AR689_07685 [Arthrobacter sp. EpRS71]
MAVNQNADDYANARLGIYFPGHPATLTGQCVSLIKWYLGEMCGVAEWQAARGHAKDFGDTLVSQGLATVVSAGSRKRGDLVVWKQDGGGYGHIGVLCSNDNVFEENVGLAGSKSAVYGGNTVYASRIDPLNAVWRKGPPTFYRVKTYVESIQQPQGGDMVTNRDQLNKLYEAVLRRPRGAGEGEDVYLGKDSGFVFNDLYASRERSTRVQAEANEKASLITQRDQAKAKSIELVSSVSTLTSELAEAKGQIVKLKATQGGGLDQQTKDDIAATKANTSWIAEAIKSIFNRK